MEDTSTQAKQWQIAVVRSLDGGTAVLELADGQILRWPVVLLAAGVKLGDEVRLTALAGKSEGLEKKDLAHAVLNEIFSNKG
ncbi:MAG: hypothetical protein HY461_02220 [Parcubacteria group bacterium]|nr:hypothetical protein [Parcubacteria group bacterium]